jgi:NO-binding membrane sensor protein with MHYT domain
MTVIGCIAHMHDMRLVLIALITCALSSFTTLKMIGRAQAASRELRLAWTMAGGVAFGCGVWAAHFVAVLAYRPEMPVSYNAMITAISLVIAVSGSAMALTLMLDGSKQGAIGAGMLLGGVVALMHYAGMSAMMVPGIVALDSRLIVESLAVGMSFAPIALLLHRKGRMVSAVALLVLAICGLHFVAVAAISIIPDGRTIAGIATGSLAIAVAAVSLLVILVALTGVLVDEHLARRAKEEHVRVKRFADATFEGLLFVKAGIIADANAVACTMLERSVEALVGTPLHDVFAAPQGPSRGRHAGLVDAACVDAVETSYVDAKGARRFVEVLGRPATEADRGITVLAVRDISDRKRAEDRIERLAHFDSLTGLANRLLFRDRVQVALAVAERSKMSVAMLCLDLDRFKAINDLMGPRSGTSC